MEELCDARDRLRCRTHGAHNGDKIEYGGTCEWMNPPGDVLVSLALPSRHSYRVIVLDSSSIHQRGDKKLASPPSPLSTAPRPIQSLPTATDETLARNAAIRPSLTILHFIWAKGIDVRNT